MSPEYILFLKTPSLLFTALCLVCLAIYSRVHISSDEVFSKILKKPSVVQKKDTSYAQ